jgi:hypothetical protein
MTMPTASDCETFRASRAADGPTLSVGGLKCRKSRRVEEAILFLRAQPVLMPTAQRDRARFSARASYSASDSAEFRQSCHLKRLAAASRKVLSRQVSRKSCPQRVAAVVCAGRGVSRKDRRAEARGDPHRMVQRRRSGDVHRCRGILLRCQIAACSRVAFRKPENASFNLVSRIRCRTSQARICSCC